MFARGSTRECHTVSILQDDNCEQPPENFFADLAYASGMQPININIPTTRVIIDDSKKLECGKFYASCTRIMGYYAESVHTVN